MAPMPPFSLFRSMQGLPWYLVPIWPLIYLQIRRLQAWFYANCGPESEMHWAVTHHGRVDLIRLSDDMCVTPKHPWVPIPLSPNFSTALAGESALPTHPCPLRRQGRRIPASRTHSPLPAQGRRAYLLPLPDT